MGVERFGLHYMKFLEDTIVDGEGLRDSLYLSGCRHACPGCHNRDTWHGKAGHPLTDRVVAAIIERIKYNPLLCGLTITGGDPFYNPEGLYALLKEIKEETGCNIWCYTGYTLEQLAAQENLTAPLEFIDTLVDGPFIQAKRSLDLKFKGSSNQRIIAKPFEKVLELQSRRQLAVVNWVDSSPLRK